MEISLRMRKHVFFLLNQEEKDQGLSYKTLIDCERKEKYHFAQATGNIAFSLSRTPGMSPGL